MKNYFNLLLTGILFRSILCSPNKKNDSNWFKKCLKTKSETERGIEFDMNVSKEFIKKVGDTSAFSPICCDFNILMQCANNDFGSENIIKGKNELKFLVEQYKETNPAIFKAMNRLDQNVGVLHNDIEADGYQHKFFTMDDAEKAFDDYEKWVKKESNGLLSPPINYLSFKSAHRIYTSLVYFKDSWLKVFNEKKSVTRDFHLNNGNKISRKFMSKESSYPYKKVKGEVEYEILAIPYNERNEKGIKRFMVYLIPSKYEMDLSKLWAEFQASFNGKIKDLITKEMKSNYVNIKIPKLEKLESSFDLAELLKDVFQNNTAESCSSKMVTYLNVDEKGTEAAACMSSLCIDGHCKNVIADRPHLSFIFDMEFQRILFITKDTGIINK